METMRIQTTFRECQTVVKAINKGS